MTLVDFLKARLDEDEAVARGAADSPWRVEPNGEQPRVVAPSGGWAALTSDNPGGERGRTAAHIARHDPARVLADVEAKRRIVELWAEEWPEWHGPGSGLTRTRMTEDQYSRVINAERVLGLLALRYADHADYRPEWAPT